MEYPVRPLVPDKPTLLTISGSFFAPFYQNLHGTCIRLTKMMIVVGNERVLFTQRPCLVIEVFGHGPFTNKFSESRCSTCRSQRRVRGLSRRSHFRLEPRSYRLDATALRAGTPTSAGRPRVISLVPPSNDGQRQLKLNRQPSPGDSFQISREVREPENPSVIGYESHFNRSRVLSYSLT